MAADWTIRPWQPGDELAALTALLHRAMLLDTAEPATSLRRRHAHAGDADIATVQWQGKAYRSVVMVKPLAHPAPTDTDPGGAGLAVAGAA